jgi:hypothetical protein
LCLKERTASSVHFTGSTELLSNLSFTSLQTLPSRSISNSVQNTPSL